MECIIFDKDGTLLDFSAFWIPVAKNGVTKICNHFNVSDDVKNCIYKEAGVGETIGIDSIVCYGSYEDIGELIYKVFKENGINESLKDVVDFSAKAFESVSKTGQVKPTTPKLKELLQKLKNRGSHLFVATADSINMTKYCLDKLEITDFFEEILTEDGIHIGKPNPYYINYLAKKYGFDKKDMCMIGDTVNDMKFGINGNINCYGVGIDEKSRNTLSKYANAVAKDVEELFEKNEI